jgi:hypothetical protein
MRYAGIDEATPDLARDAHRPTQRRLGWLEDLTTRLAVAATLAAAVAGAALWLARAGRGRDVARAGGHLNIVRCPVHGISYDAELEECTECAKAGGGPGRPRHLASVPGAPSSPSSRPLPRSVE